MPEQAKNKPANELRIGMLKAAIWRNEGTKDAWHNVTFERSYRDGETWKSSDNFGRDDLLALAKLADQAHYLNRRGGGTAAKHRTRRVVKG